MLRYRNRLTAEKPLLPLLQCLEIAKLKCYLLFYRFFRLTQILLTLLLTALTHEMAQQQALLGLEFNHLVQLVRHLKHLVSYHHQRFIVFHFFQILDVASGIHELRNAYQHIAFVLCDVLKINLIRDHHFLHTE